jgi:hypothetical protein
MVDGRPLVFLSPAWMAALAEAAGSDADVAAAAPATGAVVRHEVTACPPDGRTVVYTVRAEPAGPTTVVVDDPMGDVAAASSGCRPGVAGGVTASFSAPYDAALAVLRGDTNAQRLLADGRLRVDGDLDALADLGRWLEALARSWAPVRARTRA